MSLSDVLRPATKRVAIDTCHARGSDSSCASCVKSARPSIGLGGSQSVSHGIRVIHSASHATAHFEIRSARPPPNA